MHRLITLLALLLFSANSAHAQDGFKPLFNGKDLAGWHNVNCAPSTWFVKDKMIITTGKPTGYLRTDRQYENFILEFEWLHAPKKIRDKEVTRKSGELLVHEGNVGNSGMFVWGDPLPAVGTGYTRSIEVQVLVGLRSTVAKTGATGYTSHGDLFSIHGAKCRPDRAHPLKWERCLPSENRCKGEYEWNHYRVTANNGVLKLAVNGKEVSGVSQSNPRKGYLALESEGSECRFKNLKIKELPSTNPKPNEICDVDKGWKCVFTGLDLNGWKATDEHKTHWKMSDGVLNYNGKGGETESVLWSEKSYGDFELVCDSKPGGVIFMRGSRVTGIVAGRAEKGWSRAVLRVKGNTYRIIIDGKDVTDVGQLEKGAAKSGPIALAGENAVQFRNVFIRELKRGE
ncbi:MAG: DUF1080 domain-containing protein [Planctomycetes bacterium]|nr:DUF1080 domain-containing protein [Planctomycetota bacterium]